MTPFAIWIWALLIIFLYLRIQMWIVARGRVKGQKEDNKVNLDESIKQMSREDYDILVASGWKPSEEVRAHFIKPTPRRRFYRDGWYTEEEYQRELAWEQKRGVGQQMQALAKAKAERRALTEEETFSAEERKARIAVENAIRAKAYSAPYISIGENKPKAVLNKDGLWLE